MSESLSTPRRILFATDLSARCDRALDRAAQLALQWDAELLVLHALSRPVDIHDIKPLTARSEAAIQAERELRRDLRLDTGNYDGLKLKVRVEEGNPIDVTLRVYKEFECDFIVTGIASGGIFNPVKLGSTVDELVRKASVPVLVVKNRPREPYLHIAVGTDFSEGSRHALNQAVACFPKQPLTVLNAYTVPFENAGNKETIHADGYRTFAEEEGKTFLNQSTQTVRDAAYLKVVNGTPSTVISNYVRERGADLVIMGTHGRSALLEALIGSTAREILAETPCDVLVVRQPK